MNDNLDSINGNPLIGEIYITNLRRLSAAQSRVIEQAKQRFLERAIHEYTAGRIRDIFTNKDRSPSLSQGVNGREPMLSRRERG